MQFERTHEDEPQSPERVVTRYYRTNGIAGQLQETLTPLPINIRITNQMEAAGQERRSPTYARQFATETKQGIPRLPEFSIGGHSPQHFTDRQAVDPIRSCLREQFRAEPRSSAYTDRISYHRPTEQLSVVTLAPSDDRSQHSCSQPVNPQVVADKLRHIVEEIWLMVFGKPFKLNLKSGQQRYQLCGAVYSLQQAANQHRQFVTSVAEAVGADPSNEDFVRERCRESIDCLIQMDAVRGEQQSKLEEYLAVIDDLTQKIEDQTNYNRELAAEINLRDEALRNLHDDYEQLLQHVRSQQSSEQQPTCLDQQAEELATLRVNVHSLKQEKSELLLTIEREVTTLKCEIEALLDEKISLIKKLMAAESYVNELKITNDHQINDLTMALQRQRKVSASLAVSRQRLQSPRNSRLAPAQEDLYFQVANHLDCLMHQSKDRSAVLQKFVQANRLSIELNIANDVLRQYNENLEQAVMAERQANRELRQEIAGLQATLEEVRLEISYRVTPREHIVLNASNELDNSYRGKVDRLEKENVDLLVFFDDLLENLAGRCAEENQRALQQDILELLAIVQQKRAELPQRLPTNSSSASSRLANEGLFVPQPSSLNSMITSPRPTTHEKLASPSYCSPHLMMCSPQMQLKACRSNQKLALRSDDIEQFEQSVEQLFNCFGESLNQELACELLQFVKQLHLYPHNTNLLALTQRMLSSLRELELVPGGLDERDDQINNCLTRMERVFQEMESGPEKLQSVLEEKVETVDLEYSEGASNTSKVTPALSSLSRQVETAVQANLEEQAELEQIELIRQEIRGLQDEAQVFRDSLNLCLETSSKVELSRLCTSPATSQEN